MRQDTSDSPVAPGAAPRRRQRLLEVLLKRPRQAWGPGHALVGPFLGPQISQKQAQVAALDLLRRRTRRHGMLEIPLNPPRQAVRLTHACNFSSFVAL